MHVNTKHVKKVTIQIHDRHGTTDGINVQMALAADTRWDRGPKEANILFLAQELRKIWIDQQLSTRR